MKKLSVRLFAPTVDHDSIEVIGKEEIVELPMNVEGC
jgi:hypothetical protein